MIFEEKHCTSSKLKFSKKRNCLKKQTNEKNLSMKFNKKKNDKRKWEKNLEIRLFVENKTETF